MPGKRKKLRKEYEADVAATAAKTKAAEEKAYGGTSSNIYPKLIPNNLDTRGYKPEEGGVIGQRKEQFSEGTFKTPPPPPYSGTPYSGPTEDITPRVTESLGMNNMGPMHAEGAEGHKHPDVGSLTKKETVPVPAHRGKTSQINLGGGKAILGLDLGPRGHKYTSKKKVKK